MTTVIKDKIMRPDQSLWDGLTSTTSRKDSTGGTIVGLKIGTEVDVLQVYGGGVNYTKSTIQKCLDAIGSSRTVTLVFNPGTWSIDENLTIGSNFCCRVPNGTVFSVSSGKTLTFSGPVIRDGQTWTSGSGTVVENGTRYFSGLLDFSSSVIQGSTPLVFEGSTANAFETRLSITDPTADRTITIPDADVDLGMVNGICEGRLTLTTATPVTTANVTAATTVFFTPFKGNRIALYDGTTWGLFSFSEVSIAVPATTITMYDVFAYNSSGTVTLELTAWTNDTTRATALAFQNGVYVKSGTTTRRYLGSFRTTGVSGQTEDSLTKRYVWNYYNRVKRSLVVTDATSSWNYTTATLRQANGSTSNQVEAIIGVTEDMFRIEVESSFSNSGAANAAAGVGVDSTSANSATLFGGGTGSGGNVSQVNAVYQAYPAVGYHFYAWLEISQASGTTTWYGTSSVGSVPVKSGLTGEMLG